MSPLDYSVSCDSSVSWLVLEGDVSGAIQPGEHGSVSLNFSLEGLSFGIYDCELTINSNSPDLPIVSIPVFIDFRGRTLRVPDDYTSIQAAINDADNGDSVLVAPGTYFENIDFIGKSIVVTSDKYYMLVHGHSLEHHLPRHPLIFGAL
jgi:hypothetical protein